MEEAADLEINAYCGSDPQDPTADTQTVPSLESPKNTGDLEPSKKQFDNDSDDLQWEASTPQKPGSRTSLLLSEPASEGQKYQPLIISPKKRTPAKKASGKDDRNHALEILLNSSPTLEPPILLSEVGRTTVSNSESAPENVQSLSSDLENVRLNRLLPIPITLTPVTTNKSASARSTPLFNVQLLESKGAKSTETLAASDIPSLRHNEFLDTEDSDIVKPQLTAKIGTGNDDSNITSFQQFESVARNVRDRDEAELADLSGSPKRRKSRSANNTEQNVFESPDRSSTLYHSINWDLQGNTQDVLRYSARVGTESGDTEANPRIHEESQSKDLEESQSKDLGESQSKDLEEGQSKDLEEGQSKDLEESQISKDNAGVDNTESEDQNK